MLIRDPVHGDIFLSKIEKEVLNTPELQRLRGIRQLGLVYTVYPGAMHTRFEHSIGTCHLAKRILAEMKAANKIPNKALTPKEEEAITVAALVHDIGHLPFGHTLEDERGIFKNLKDNETHDDPKRVENFLVNSNVGKILQKNGLFQHVLNILMINAVHPPKDFPKSKLWQVQLVSNTICADLLDYIKRDAYFVGVSLNYDQRILKYFSILDGKMVMVTEKNNMVRLDARSDILHLLNCRCDLAEKVYLHHGVLAAGSMVAKAVEMYGIEHLKDRLQLLHILQKMTDDQLLYFLKESSTEKANKSINNLATRVLERKLYKRAYVLDHQHLNDDAINELTNNYYFNTEKRRNDETLLKKELGLPENEEAIIYCAGIGALKEADVFITYGGRPRQLSAGFTNETPTDIAQINTRYKDLWKLYVFVPPEVNSNKAKLICNKIIGYECRFSDQVKKVG